MKTKPTTLKENLLRPTDDCDCESGLHKKSEPPRAGKAFIFMAFIFPALAGLLFGYDIGATSSALVHLNRPDQLNLQASPTIASLCASCSLGGAFIAMVLVFFVGDWLAAGVS